MGLVNTLLLVCYVQVTLAADLPGNSAWTIEQWKAYDELNSIMDSTNTSPPYHPVPPVTNEQWKNYQDELNKIMDTNNNPPAIAAPDDSSYKNVEDIKSPYDTSYPYDSSYTYSYSYSDYSGVIMIILFIKIVLLSIYCCRRPTRNSNGTPIRVPDTAQPRSFTIIRRHILVVVPDTQNNPPSDDSHDPASHLERKGLIDEDLPPSYEEISIPNDDS